jgi:hypothetical protein
VYLVSAIVSVGDDEPTSFWGVGVGNNILSCNLKILLTEILCWEKKLSLSKFPNLIRNHNDGPGSRFPEKFGSGSTKLVDLPSTELCKKKP